MNLFLPMSIRILKLGSPRTNLLGTERSLFVHQLLPELPALTFYVCYVTILLTQIHHLERKTSLRGSHLPNISWAGTWGRNGKIQGMWGVGERQNIRAALTFMPPSKDTSLHRANHNRATCHSLNWYSSIRYCETLIYLRYSESSQPQNGINSTVL